MYGKYYEHCILCGVRHPDVAAWQKQVVAAMEAHTAQPQHPYIQQQLWTNVDYKRYMASPRQIRTITK